MLTTLFFLFIVQLPVSKEPDKNYWSRRRRLLSEFSDKGWKLGSIDTLLKKIWKMVGNQAAVNRVLCVSTRTLRMSKTLCSVKKTIRRRTDRFVRSHVKLAFTDRSVSKNLCVNKYCLTLFNHKTICCLRQNFTFCALWFPMVRQLH